MALKRLRRFLADGPRPAEDTVLVLAPGDAAEAAPVLAALTDGRFRLSVVLAGVAEAPAGVEARRPPLAIGLALTALRVRAALVLDPDRLRGREARLMRAAVRRGVPVYGLAGGTVTPLSAQAEAGGEMDADAVAGLLARSIGVERDPRISLDRLAGRLAGTAILRPLLRRIEDPEALAARLGNPGTILCLGNGPSSTDPALGALPHDALFRVNHDWRAKGFLSEPDMVFAGVKRSMRKMGRIPLGVATARKEAALIACRVFEPWHGRCTYAVIERIAAGIAPRVEGPERPTTGAWMLAAAVALRPRRLIVAGMDMFRHPAGAYAEGADTNAYTPAHGYQTDAAFIAACLGHFRGELMILSPALREIAEAIPSPGFALIAAPS